MKAIVIGGVAAGMSAASKLRRVMPDAQITVYERGGYLSYGACGLPYYIGGFNDDPGRLIARTREQYAQMRIDTFLHHEVLSVDAAAKRVRVRDNDSGREFEDSYDALMIAVGCDSVAPKVPGADLPSVFYLKTMEDGLLLHEILRLRDVTRVAVVGGGNVAMDAARCSKRLGAEVYVVYRRGMEELPARHEEVEHAIEEGVIFKTLNNPVQINGDEQDCVKSMTCIEMELGEPDASGRRRPVEKKGSEFDLSVDAVIMSLGTSPNPLIKSTTKGLEVNKKGGIIVNEEGLTSRQAVYAGGDAVTGAATVILAMGAGKLGAKSIDEYLSK